MAVGKLPRTIELLETVRDAKIAKLGTDHPDTLITFNVLAVAYWAEGQLDKSIPLFEHVLERREAVLGPQHPSTLLTASNLGVNYKDAGRLGEALPLLEQGYRASRQTSLASRNRSTALGRLLPGGEID